MILSWATGPTIAAALGPTQPDIHSGVLSNLWHCLKGSTSLHLTPFQFPVFSLSKNLKADTCVVCSSGWNCWPSHNRYLPWMKNVRRLNKSPRQDSWAPRFFPLTSSSSAESKEVPMFLPALGCARGSPGALAQDVQMRGKISANPSANLRHKLMHTWTGDIIQMINCYSTDHCVHKGDLWPRFGNEQRKKYLNVAI